MQAVELYEFDIPIVQEWWDQRGTPLPSEILPKLAFGSWDGDILACAAFLHLLPAEGGKIGWITWTCSNPDYPLKSFKGINCMLEYIKEYGRENGVIAIMCSTYIDSLKRLYRSHGFAGEDTTLFQCKL